MSKKALYSSGPGRAKQDSKPISSTTLVPKSLSGRQKKLCHVQEALDLVLQGPEANLELALARLWRNWSAVVGTQIASLVRPLGRRKTTMILGATNSMVMQEFSFWGPEVVAKANEFLGTTYFQQVRLELMDGRPGLDQPLVTKPSIMPKAPRPEPLGNLLPCMDPSSPVTSCYHAYVQHFYPELMISKK